MAIDFPNTPTVGQTLTVGSITWTYDGSTWKTASPQPTITNIAGGVAGSMPYQSGVGVTSQLAPGTAGRILTSNGVSAPTWADAPSYNYLINGAFDFWQRGTSLATSYAMLNYLADRWFHYKDGSGATTTVSQVAFTPNELAAANTGIEPAFYLRLSQTTAGTGAASNNIGQRIEDVRTLAGKTATISFWAKADTNTRTITPTFFRGFGSGGSTGDTALVGSAVTLSTSWVRYSQTVTLPSIAGKTIGVGSYLEAALVATVNTTQTIDIWGVQLEAGSFATSFRRNAPSIQAELAACQRYYWRMSSNSTVPYMNYGTGFADQTTTAMIQVKLPVTMRAIPNALDYSTLNLTTGGTNTAVTSAAFLANSTHQDLALVYVGSSGLTVNRPYHLTANNSSSSYLGISAEL